MMKKQYILFLYEGILLRLKEPSVLLHCRKDDLHSVESVLHSAKNEYAEKAKVHSPKVIVDHITMLMLFPGKPCISTLLANAVPNITNLQDYYMT